MKQINRLELKDINQYFNNEFLFDKDINLSIDEKSITLLYGGSGSGKTSLLNILIGQIKPKKGKVCWIDREIISLSQANKLRANFMSVFFSNFSFINELSIKENILLAATLCKVQNIEKKLDEITNTLLNFKIEDKNIDLGRLIEKESISTLSNGQKEIITLASTLLLQTNFFIADEMLRSFPDKTKKIIFKRLLEYFKKENIALFYVTHWAEAIDIIKESGFKHKVYFLKNKKLQLQ